MILEIFKSIIILVFKILYFNLYIYIHLQMENQHHKTTNHSIRPLSTDYY